MKILLVDDEQHSRQSMLWFLKRQRHEVTECSSGEEALTKYSPEEFPMVLSDIQMPGMTGNQLTAAIKARPEFRGGVLSPTKGQHQYLVRSAEKPVGEKAQLFLPIANDE